MVSKAGIKDCILKYRKSCLTLFGVFGIILLTLTNKYFDCIQSFIYLSFSEKTQSSLELLVLALPVAFLLWYYRNHDKLELLSETSFRNKLEIINDIENKIENKKGQASSYCFLTLLSLRKENSFRNLIDSILETFLLDCVISNQDIGSYHIDKSCFEGLGEGSIQVYDQTIEGTIFEEEGYNHYFKNLGNY